MMIPAAAIEFNEGGNTLWVHGPEGGTILRLKFSGKITSKVCKASPVPHADAMCLGDLEFCIPRKRKRRPRP